MRFSIFTVFPYLCGNQSLNVSLFDMKKLVLFIVLLAVACSCSTTFHARLKDERHIQVEGLTSGELISQFGAPAREMSDGRDGKILVFTGDRVFDYRASKFGGTLPELQCFMDADDVCYRYDLVNMKSKKVFSAGRTILFLIFLGILPLPFL